MMVSMDISISACSVHWPLFGSLWKSTLNFMCGGVVCGSEIFVIFAVHALYTKNFSGLCVTFREHLITSHVS